MCGIAGIMTTGQPEGAEAAVKRMVTASRHRGPDGSGTVTIAMPRNSGHLILGHTRLSIIDLTQRASQPMRDERTGSWLVYNGEIYNFRELRHALEQSGVEFASEGDTEVLLKALVTWGDSALKRLRGMFAFAFWDGRRKEFLLGRDPLGIKPLYYFHRPGLLLFASEVKVLQASGAHDFAVDPIATDSFLTYGAVLGPRTILDGVKELPAGHRMSVSLPEKASVPQAFWRFAETVAPRPPQTGFAEALSAVRQRFEHAVDSHLVSDVPLGILLSGGIDSALVAHAAAQRHSNLALFTVDFPEEEFSELKAAAETARQLGLRHEVARLSASQFEALCGNALQAVDQPTVDGLNTYVVCNAASALGFRVLLSGLGGDELFGGYTTFRKAPQLARWQPALKLLVNLLPALPRKSIPWAKVRQARALRGLGEAYLLQRSIRWDRFRTEAQSNGHVENQMLASLAAELPDGADTFLRIAQLELCIYMRNQLLRDADVFSMANSVELRVPFLDPELVGTALSLPRSSHFDLRGGKRITRRLLNEMSGKEPARKKVGFLFPWQVWLRGALKSMLFDTLLSQSLYDRVALDFASAQRLIHRFERNDPLVSWSHVWSLFVLLRWAKREVRQASHAAA